MAKKQIIQGIDNFKELIDLNGYYVDKTLFIKELLDRKDKITLITRPRRFGKTINMSMLKYFFENPECRQIKTGSYDVSYLFEGLNIFKSGNEYMQHLGKYPVIFISFKTAKQKNWSDTLYNIKDTISKEYKRHQYLLAKNIMDEDQEEKFRRISKKTAENIEYTDAIADLTELLSLYFKEDCIVLIDEFDTPIQAGYLNGYFEDVIEFLKSFLLKGFKDNEYLKQGVLTGIMKVAQESIFSDFNNPTVCTLLSERYKDKFGFTETEIEKMAKYLGLEPYMEDVKSWYNGYVFGLDTVIYNPWSIMKYMSTPDDGLRPYWSNTSDNSIINEVLQLNKLEGKKVIEKLIKGEDVSKVIDENIVYQNIKTQTDVAWSFLLHAGYLKAFDRKMERIKFKYKLAIPNLEIKTIYEDIIIKFLQNDEKIYDIVQVIIKSLLDNDFDKFERLIKELYLKQVSFYDFGNKKINIDTLEESEQNEKFESFHHGLFLGLFIQIGYDYMVDSNKELGLGRPDIVIIPNDNTKTVYIFEFKWESTKGSTTIESLADSAIKQIKNKKYKDGVKIKFGHENIKCIGVGFKGKELKMILIDD